MISRGPHLWRSNKDKGVFRMSELQQLAKLYGTSINALLRKEAVHVDLTPQFRKLSLQLDDAVEHAVQLLSELAKAEVELENLLGVRTHPELSSGATNSAGRRAEPAEQNAHELRQWLGLGSQTDPGHCNASGNGNGRPRLHTAGGWADFGAFCL